MSRPSKRLRTSLLFLATGFCLIAAVNIYEFILAKDLQHVVKVNDELQSEELEVQRLVALVLDTSAAQRVYLASQHSANLSLYTDAKNATLTSLAALQELQNHPLPRDLNKIHEHIAELLVLIKRKVASMDRTNAEAASGNWSAARIAIDSAQVRSELGAIRGSALEIQRILAQSTSAMVEATALMTRKDSLADLFGILFELPLFVLAVLSIYRENRALLQAEDELQRSTSAADAANASKSSFLAAMSHEIRTPLGVMIGYADMLTSASLTEANRRYAENIKRNGQVLLALVNDILDLAKVESGKIDVEKRRFYVVPYFRELISHFQVKAAEKALSLAIKMEGAIPETIETDDLRFRQILTNILGNALKFTERGSVTVVVRLHNRLDTAQPLLEVTIEDTGPGVAPDHRAKIFEPFTQAAAYITRKFGGTGLGLSLARKLAFTLGGDLRLEWSEVGIGSKFAITIDPGDLSGVRLLQPNEIVSYKTGLAAPPTLIGQSQLARRTILLVEDFPDNQLMMKTILAHHGATVAVAANGLEGVQMAQAARYDLVLMDIQMPVMNGYVAVARLRREGYDRPIIALTAEAMKGELERCIAAGFDDYLAKPVSRADLISMAERYMDTRSAYAKRPAPPEVARSKPAKHRGEQRQEQLL